MVLKFITNRGSLLITNRGRFCYYKSGQELFQIGAAHFITNRGKFITNRGRYYKSGQLLQIGAEQLEPNHWLS